nr:Os03g0379200 [Ipomoea batatas]GMD84540.1 Os03g0379200 [Ipomoea batatas]
MLGLGDRVMQVSIFLYQTSSGSADSQNVALEFSCAARHESASILFCQIAISPFSDFFSQQRSLATSSIFFCSSRSSSSVLNGLLHCQALVRCISIRNIVTTLWPRKWGNVSFRRWNKAMQLLFLRRAMSFSVVHIFSRESHGTALILAWGVISVLSITRLDFFHF